MNQLNALAIAFNEAKITVLLPEQMMFVKGGCNKRKKKSRSNSGSNSGKKGRGCGTTAGTGTGAGTGGSTPPVVSLP